ncbi:MAG: sulfotransferase family protein [Gammaproteobacteria bacterium]
MKLDLNLESGVAPDDIKALTDGLTGDLSSLFSHPVQPFRRRVFCIGWPKTGTTSFTEALRILGLFSCPWAPWVIGYKHVRSEISEFRIDFSGVADYTAVSNLPICALYRELDIAFPGSLFILTTRPLETWTISETAEWTTSEIADRDSDIKQYVNMDAMSRWAYGTDAIDKEVHQERYLQHQEQVLGYFSGRPDFLAIDISQGNPWQKLCEFLQLPVPQVAFPHLNRRMT